MRIQIVAFGKAVEYARFADDLVILMDSQPHKQWLRQAVEKRLLEALAKLLVEDEDASNSGSAAEASAAPIKVDSEGGVKAAESKTRFIAPACSSNSKPCILRGTPC